MLLLYAVACAPVPVGLAKGTGSGDDAAAAAADVDDDILLLACAAWWIDDINDGASGVLGSWYPAVTPPMVGIASVTDPVSPAELMMYCRRVADRSALAKGGCCVALPKEPPVPEFKCDASAIGKALAVVPEVAIALSEVGGRAMPRVLTCCPLSLGRAIVDRKS